MRFEFVLHSPLRSTSVRASLLGFALVCALPCSALAGWGENWGEMVWGAERARS